MTAHELASILLAGPDMPVHLACPSGDYWGTMLAPAVRRVEPEAVFYSEYHRCDALPVLAGEDDEREDEEKTEDSPVILLRG